MGKENSLMPLIVSAVVAGLLIIDIKAGMRNTRAVKNQNIEIAAALRLQEQLLKTDLRLLALSRNPFADNFELGARGALRAVAELALEQGDLSADAVVRRAFDDVNSNFMARAAADVTDSAAAPKPQKHWWQRKIATQGNNE